MTYLLLPVAKKEKLLVNIGKILPLCYIHIGVFNGSRKGLILHKSPPLTSSGSPTLRVRFKSALVDTCLFMSRDERSTSVNSSVQVKRNKYWKDTESFDVSKLGTCFMPQDRPFTVYSHKPMWLHRESSNRFRS